MKKILDTKTRLFGLVLCLLLLSFQGMATADVQTIYDQVSVKYPEEMAILEAEGANEDNIQGFLTALQEELDAYENLNPNELNEQVEDIILGLMLDEAGTHDVFFNAIFTGWDISLKDALSGYGEVSQKLPQTVKDMIEEAKNEFLQELVIQEDGAGTGSGGGLGGGGMSAAEEIPAVAEETVISSADEILARVENGIVLMDEIESSLSVTADSLVDIFSQQEKIMFADAEAGFVLTLTEELLTETTKVKINIQKMAEATRQSLQTGLSDEQKIMGNVYDVNLELIRAAEMESEEVTDKQKTLLSLKFDSNWLEEGFEFWVAHYDEETGVWEKLASQLDLAAGQISCWGEKFSPYTILKAPKVEFFFEDLDDHWARQEVEYLFQRGLVHGLSAKTFAPQKQVTRAEFVTMLVNLLDLRGERVSGSFFADVDLDAWYGQAVNIAFEKGLISGRGNGEFAPQANISRQEMAVMMANALEYRQVEMIRAENSLTGYQDETEISFWAKDAMGLMVKNQLIYGRGEKIIAPRENASRAEAAVIIKRCYDRL